MRTLVSRYLARGLIAADKLLTDSPYSQMLSNRYALSMRMRIEV